MEIILFDNNQRQKLYPLNNFCAVADLLAGAFTFKERWEKLTGQSVWVFTENYLEKLYPAIPIQPALWIDASLMPDMDLFNRILSLEEEEALIDSNGLIAGKKIFTPQNFNSSNVIKDFATTYRYEAKRIQYPWDLFQLNHDIMVFDFENVISKNPMPPLPDNNNFIEPKNIFIEKSVDMQFCSLNASTGPIYIGENSLVMEGCTIRGPFVMRERSVLKMGSCIYGATSIGSACIVGGEVKNSIINNYSNKGHHGYLGDSVMGKWCNLGAGTSNSNLKNNAGSINIWDHSTDSFRKIGNKCGMIMGDFGRTAINSSINTGTIIGSCTNVFGRGLLPKFIPDFSWDIESATRYDFKKAIRDMDEWMKMKGKFIDKELSLVMKHIFELSK